MTDTWRRVKTIVGEALERPEDERHGFIGTACAGDDSLRNEVDSLLAATIKAERHFETPSAALGARDKDGLTIGGAVGPYRIVRALGTGGMGAVYLAERTGGEFQQRVAVKVVRGGFGTPLILDRFREERRILATLDHPNIARLIDGGTTAAGLPYVLMDYVEGEPIDQFCRSQRLDVRRRLAVFLQVCAAVHYAHQRLVVHRDIKAANILVTADGTPKLLDFGIAKLTDPESGQDQTVTQYRVATPESASPEQLQGRPITLATDVYALGVLLYRLLTGESPYGPRPLASADLIRTVCEHQPLRPSAAARRRGEHGELPAAEIPNDLDIIVLKALRKEPERRYGTVEEMAADLQRFLAGRPVLAAPDRLSYRARKFIRRHRAAVAGAVVLTAAVAAGVAATLWQAQVARQERARAERQFAAVRTLAQSVLGELHDAVSRLPGSLAAREVLLRRTTEYLDALDREIGDNSVLRREVAEGYGRLGQLQGWPGMENLGDPGAARRNYEKVLTLLEPLAARGDALPQDHFGVINARLRLVNISSEEEKGQLLEQVRARIEALPAGVRGSRQGLSLESSMWSALATQHVGRRHWPGARDAYGHALRTAEGVLQLSPDDLNARRNVSLACKQLGAVLEMLQAPAEARALYDRALGLDSANVERDPGRGVWRLDLSFSLGSIGALLQSAGNLDGALEHYTRAVDLRRVVVASEPQDDFARRSLVRGYQRLATIQGRRGQVAEAVAWHRESADLLLAQVNTHPERDQAWREYAQAAFAAISASVDLVESAPGTARPADLTVVGEMFRTFADVRTRWVAGKRGGDLAPSDDEFGRLAARLRRLHAGPRLAAAR